MHLLPCPHCESSISVSPSQAGDTTQCPHCQSLVHIPKLGDIRQLPLDEAVASAPSTRPNDQMEPSTGRRAGFVVFALLATASLLVAGFCGIRWVLVDVPATTDEHISMFRDEYSTLSAARLIREYEDMEEFGLQSDLVRPYPYKRLELEKRTWGRNASIAAAIGGVALLGAFGFAGTGRRNQN